MIMSENRPAIERDLLAPLTENIEFLKKIREISPSKGLADCITAFLEGHPAELAVSKFEKTISKEKVAFELGSLVIGEARPWKQKIRAVAKHINSAEARGMLNSISSQDAEEEKIKFFAMMLNRSQYAEDLVATRASAEWLDDPHFQQAYEAGASISNWGTKIRWRIYTLLRAAKLASRVEGDFVECGVNNGGCSKSVIAYLGADAFRDRRFYLFDTYQGLVDSQLTDSERSKWSVPDGYYPNVLEKVRQNFKDDHFSQIVVGAVPDTLSEFKGDKVAYVHIDMNVALPEVEAFRFFWPKLSSGGVVVFDDYGFPSHVEQQRGLDAVARDFGVEIMMLPTGQGIVWK